MENPSVPSIAGFTSHQSESLALSNLSRKRTIYCEGSSLTSQGWFDVSTRKGWDWRAPSSVARFLTGNRHHWVNSGVTGTTSAEIEARIFANVLRYRPEIVILQSGTNDISNAITLSDLNSITKRLYDMVLMSGAKLIACAIEPRRQAGSGWTTTESRLALEANAWRRQYCELHANAYFFDTTKYLVDPTDANGQQSASYTNDDTHYTPRGAYQSGVLLAQMIRDISPICEVLDFSNLIKSGSNEYLPWSVNPSLLGTGGGKGTGVTGSVADSWTCDRVSGTTTGTVVASIAAISATDIRREQTLVFTGGASATENFYFRTTSSNTSIDATKTFEGVVEIDVSAWDGWRDIILQCTDETGGVKTYVDGQNGLGGGTYKLTDKAFSGVLRTPKFTGVGTSRIRLFVGIDGAAAGTGTIKIRNPSLRRVYTELTDGVD